MDDCAMLKTNWGLIIAGDLAGFSSSPQGCRAEMPIGRWPDAWGTRMAAEGALGLIKVRLETGCSKAAHWIDSPV